MKRLPILAMLAVLLGLCLGVQASADVEYTLSVKNNTVLQDMPDRDIAVRAARETRAAAAGESPVTGLQWEGRYLPMLVQIGNTADTVQVNGYSVKASGIGRYTPWGVQYADIIYEQSMYGTGYTRFTMLFSDCFASGEPEAGVGPVRSCRYGPLLLREEWQAGLVYGGGLGPRGDQIAALLADDTALQWGLLINTRSAALSGQMGYIVRGQGKKSPNTYNAYLIKARDSIPETYAPEARPFLFQEGGAYADGYAEATTVNLDWGYKYNISHFVYDEANGTYTRCCGAGINPQKWVPFTAYPTAEDSDGESRLPLTFANVIVQRVTMTYETGSVQKPIVQLVGRGNADIFIDGRYIPGYWVCESIGEPTVYTDDQGNELRLNRGKTFIAQFPAEGRCTFTGAE